MYVDTFIPYHMYVCIIYMYGNIFTVCDIRIHCRAGPADIFRRTCFNDPVAEIRSYAVLTGLAAAIRSHCRAEPAAVLHSHCCTADPAAAIVAPAQLLKFSATVEYLSSC